MLDSGEKLVATARSAKDLAFLPASERLRTLALDVTDPAAARAAVKEAVSYFGRLDVVVNNAGFIRADSVEDQPEEEFRRQLEINFFGAYHLAHAALPTLHAQRSGHLIFVSSIGARKHTPGLGAYQSAKAAVGALSEVLAKEVAPFGVRVTCVEPGGMRTDMFDASMLSESLKPDYEPTVGTVIRGAFGDPQRATSDPKRVAQAILRVAQEQEPPVRLLLGSDAFRMGTAALAVRLEEDERWKDLSISTDYR
ncbi:Dehydrogenase [Labilithrix luteola]|uniref:Dehydrogenase n=1 Tax=Labilithrix luteola TaxID=1391654 RepID=A0A0K1QEW8_9BACT|nr:Dehydrogenase [Labilithrix luteola]